MKNSKLVVGVLILVVIALAACSSVEKDWQDARQVNSLEAFNEFLQNHGDGPFADSARTVIEILMWQEAQTQNAVNGYESFIEAYESGPYTEQAVAALRVLEDREWEKVLGDNSIESFETYLNVFPEGQYVGLARGGIDGLRFMARLRDQITTATLLEPVPCEIVKADVGKDRIVFIFEGPTDMGEYIVGEGLRVQMGMDLSPLLIRNPVRLVPGAKGRLHAAHNEIGKWTTYSQKVTMNVLNGFIQAKPPSGGPYPQWLPIAIEITEDP